MSVCEAFLEGQASAYLVDTEVSLENNEKVGPFPGKEPAQGEEWKYEMAWELVFKGADKGYPERMNTDAPAHHGKKLYLDSLRCLEL